MSQPIEVIYIAGAPRSGSTVLARVLAQAPQALTTGEITERFLHSPEQACGCGEIVSSCKFWSAAVGKAFGGFDTPAAKRFVALHRQVGGKRYLPISLLGGAAGPLAGELRRYGETLSELFAAMLSVADARVIIDSTKQPRRGFLLAGQPFFRLHTVHLVRDSRAVSYSRRRRNLSYASPLWWDVSNLGAEALRLRSATYTRVRYEDFANRPRETLAVLGSRLPIQPPEVVPDNTVEMGVDHALQGSRVRFSQGAVQIKESAEWRTGMSRSERLRVTLATWPLLLRYGYPLSVRGASEASR